MSPLRQHPVGSVVEFMVDEIRNNGLLGRVVGTEVRGLIRYREWSWDRRLDEKSAQEEAPEIMGRPIACVVIEHADAPSRLELSARKAQPDQWRNLVKNLREGRKIVFGTVEAIGPQAYDVRLEAGLLGLIFRDSLPPHPAHDGMPELFLGDRVCARVGFADASTFRVRLDVKGAIALSHERLKADLAQQPLQVPLSELAQYHHTQYHGRTLADQLRAVVEGEFALLRDTKPTVKRLGWVENDPGGTQEIADMLRRDGCDVVLLPSTPDAFVSALKATSCDMLLVDIDLDPPFSGIDLVRRAIQEKVTTHGSVLFLTGIEDERLSLAQRLDPLDVLSKSKDLPSVFRYVRGLGPIRQRFSAVLTRRDTPRPHGTSEPAPSASYGDRRGGILEIAAEQLGAQAALLVRFEPRRGDIRVVERWPERHPPPDPEVEGRTVFSPVGDAACHGRSWRDGNCARNASRYQHVVPVWGEFASMAVEALRPLGAEGHAIVFLGAVANRFGDDRQVRRCAALVEADCENRLLRKINADLARVSFAGVLAVGMIHDLRARVMPIRGALLVGMEKAFALLNDRPDKFEEYARLWIDSAYNIDGRVSQFLEPIERLRDAAQSTQSQVFAPADAIRRAVDNIRSQEETTRAGVRIECQVGVLSPDLPGVGLALEQILFNLMLNAVQQIQLSGVSFGRIVVSAGIEARGSQKVVAIRVSDSGPGVHAADFDRMFEFGETTRRDEGSGIGLFHARDLAGRLGARVVVEESILYFGTTFLVDLPIDGRTE